MPWKYTDDYYREYTRTTWDEAAEAYVGIMRTLEPFRSAVIDRLAPRPGERILDMGTGPGEPAMTIARAVGPEGSVTGIDLSERMIAIARRVGEARQLANVDFRVMDCSALDLPEASYNAVVSCFGFQIFTDPEKAARDAHRVLRPGGRIALGVWATGDRVPFLEVLIGPMLENAEPDEDGYLPTPYETGGPGELVAFVANAGFREPVETRVRATIRYDSADDYLQAVLKGTPIGHSLSEETPETQAEVLRKTRKNLGRYASGGGIALPAESVIVTAVR